MSRYALVVGINTYQYANLPNLKSPCESAEAIAQLLETHGDFHVKRLPAAKDKENNSLRVARTLEVTSTKLRQELAQLFKPQADHHPSTALLYFAGHGLYLDCGIQESYLATSDVHPDQGNWGVSLEWLRRLLQQSPVKQQIVWLDCCHSGGLMNVDETNPGEKKGYSRCLIAASRLCVREVRNTRRNGNSFLSVC